MNGDRSERSQGDAAVALACLLVMVFHRSHRALNGRWRAVIGAAPSGREVS